MKIYTRWSPSFLPSLSDSLFESELGTLVIKSDGSSNFLCIRGALYSSPAEWVESKFIGTL